jgi:hypothetical protein
MTRTNPRFIVEGRDSVGHYAPDGRNAPFAVFDTEREFWPVEGLRFRWMARVAHWWLSSRTA